MNYTPDLAGAHAGDHAKAIDRENDRVGKEWEALGVEPWAEMSDEKQQRAIDLAETQGRRSKAISDKYARQCGRQG